MWSLVSFLIIYCSTAALGQTVQQGLQVSVFNNTAWTGSPQSAWLTPGLGFTLNVSHPMSVEQTGTLTGIEGQRLNFSCDFGFAAFAMLHVDGHLVCQAGANQGNGCTDGMCNGTDAKLAIMSRKELPVRLVVVYADKVRKAVSTSVSVELEVSDGKPPTLTSDLPVLEQHRREMQRSLLQGWGQYYDMSYLDFVLLPHGARVSLAICEIGLEGRCVTEARIDWSSSPLDLDIRLGAHAYDRSYSELYIGVNGCNMSISSSGGSELALLVKVEGNSTSCKDLALVPIGSTTWYRSNKISVESNDTLSFDAYGLDVIHVHATRSSNMDLDLRRNISALPHLAYSLGDPNFAVGFSTSSARTIQNIEAQIAAARAAEYASYAEFGALAETKLVVQAAVMWQTIYNPLEQGPVTPVIRGNPWGLDKNTANDDWAYVMFDWDNHFGALMLSLDAKELSYSALIQIVKSKTREGFVPNTAASVNKARHTQPPVGSKVLLEMFHKYNETWIVELLFDDLYDWNTFFDEHRRLPPLSIISLGSEEGDIQDARFESGLDDSPMYDVLSNTSHPLTFENGLMQLYDVGMASLHTMDSRALRELAEAIGRTHEAAILASRADEMGRLIEEHLWDDESGIYVNKFPDGSFYRRISPTSFYSMAAAYASDSHVDTMVTKWLLNSTRFCISPNGDFEGNTDTCYWGLPSIAASDPAYPPQVSIPFQQPQPKKK